jgi:hypothetical protein
VLKELQAQWKDAGPAPHEKSKELWDRFKKACDTVHEKTRAFFAKLDEEREANIKKKEELCAQAEALSGSTDWKATSEALKRLQEDWKAVGPVPRSKGDALWKRFRAACDAFFARRAEHDQELDAEREANLAKKTDLALRAEELSASTDWRATADEIKRLQEEWQTIGPVPRDKGDDIWKRFRAACDRFFEARKAAYARQDEERLANLARKEDLCRQVEALTDEPDRETAIQKVKALQAEWRTIGHVPRDRTDAIWKRFRSACDAVFAGPEVPATSAALDTSGFVNRLPLDEIREKLTIKPVSNVDEGWEIDDGDAK